MAGRPPMYKTAQQLQAKIDEYFDSCKPEYARDDEGKIIRNQKGDVVILDMNPPTVTGLALHLGFTSRQALLNYQGKKAFVDTVTRAKLRIESFVERKLYDPDIRPQGPIFALKNFGWEDRKQIDANLQGGVMVVPGIAQSEEDWEKNGSAEKKG